MEGIEDGTLIFGLNYHASSLEMTFLGMIALVMVEKTLVMITVVDIFEGVLFSGTLLSALTHLTPFNPQQGCEVSSVLCTCYWWTN